MFEKKKGYIAYIIILILIVCAGGIFYFANQKKVDLEPDVYFSLLDLNEKNYEELPADIKKNISDVSQARVLKISVDYHQYEQVDSVKLTMDFHDILPAQDIQQLSLKDFNNTAPFQKNSDFVDFYLLDFQTSDEQKITELSKKITCSLHLYDKKNKEMQSIDYQMSDYLNGTQIETDTSSYRIVTYEEVVDQLEKISKENKDTIEQHLQKAKANDMKDRNLTDQELKKELQNTQYVIAKAYDFPVLNGVYQPGGLYMIGEGDHHHIYKILYVSLDCTNTAIALESLKEKTFKGQINLSFESENQIQFFINGYFYEDGQSTYNGWIQLITGEQATMQYEVKNVKNVRYEINYSGIWNISK